MIGSDCRSSASGVLFGVAIAAIAFLPGAVAAGLPLCAAGVGSGVLLVAGQTLIQRITGDDVLSRVFGVLEGLAMASMALGSLDVPVLVVVAGSAGSLAVAGLSLAAASALLGRAILRSDRDATIRGLELRLLRGVPMFSPLSGPVLERLASAVEPLTVPSGTIVICEGELGDRFYVVADGHLVVDVPGGTQRDLAAGDAFGEIALPREIPRTATVRAVSPSRLFALDRVPFLEAHTGQARSRSIVSRLVASRIRTGSVGEPDR